MQFRKEKEQDKKPRQYKQGLKNFSHKGKQTIGEYSYFKAYTPTVYRYVFNILPLQSGILPITVTVFQKFLNKSVR